jgi:hypothetical protein
LDRSDILDIGNKDIVLYRIEFIPAIHRPSCQINNAIGILFTKIKTEMKTMSYGCKVVGTKSTNIGLPSMVIMVIP